MFSRDVIYIYIFCIHPNPTYRTRLYLRHHSKGTAVDRSGVCWLPLTLVRRLRANHWMVSSPGLQMGGTPQGCHQMRVEGCRWYRTAPSKGKGLRPDVCLSPYLGYRRM